MVKRVETTLENGYFSTLAASGNRASSLALCPGREGVGSWESSCFWTAAAWVLRRSAALDGEAAASAPHPPPRARLGVSCQAPGASATALWQPRSRPVGDPSPSLLVLEIHPCQLWAVRTGTRLRLLLSLFVREGYPPLLVLTLCPYHTPPIFCVLTKPLTYLPQPPSHCRLMRPLCKSPRFHPSRRKLCSCIPDLLPGFFTTALPSGLTAGLHSGSCLRTAGSKFLAYADPIVPSRSCVAAWAEGKATRRSAAGHVS